MTVIKQPPAHAPAETEGAPLEYGPDEWPAVRLLEVARDWARDRYPDAILVSELAVGNWGSASLDLAAITAEEIIGVEIKGDGDSPARIKLQACAYGRAATRMWMLPAPSLERRIFDKHMPIGWGRALVRDMQVEAGERDPERLANAPLQLTETLWKSELTEVAARLGVPTGKRDRVDQIQNHIAETVPMRDVRREVVAQLRRRDWLWHFDDHRVDMPETVDHAPDQPHPGPLFGGAP